LNSLDCRKREIGTAGQQRYTELPRDAALKGSLDGQTVVEYPTVYVVL
jgi:hypothetical protein